MLTPRGWWLLISAGVVTALGVGWLGAWSATIPLLGLTLLAWMLAEWALFAARFRAAAGRLGVARTLVLAGRPVPAAWAGVPVTVRVALTLAGGLRIPFVVVRDRPAGDVDVPADGTERAFDLRPGETAVIEYPVRPAAPGVLRFEGVHVRVADPGGLFYRRVFVRAPAEFLVLPPLTGDAGRRRADKRFNTLPPPGVHRLRRPGSGNELLDLRDYRPGDPPKMIAWKPSARRDRLITKEFESDVPVRCVLFVDASDGTRAGPPGRTPLARLVGVAAAAAQAAAAGRDIVGLTVFDDRRAEYLLPARTHTHMMRLTRLLAAAAGRLPVGGAADPPEAARLAFPLARELYPDLLDREVNSRPLGMYWRPLLDTYWGWLVIALFALTPVLTTRLAWLNGVAGWVGRHRPRTGAAWADLPIGVGMFLALFALPTTLALLFWGGYGVRGFFDPRRTRTARRKQLAALFAHLDRAGPAAVERFLHDDAEFAGRAARFLRGHRVRRPAEPTADGGEKVRVLADAMTRAVGRARDNELYVVLADLVPAVDDIGPLVEVVRVARARHHQVLVMVPWPADVPPPGEGTGGSGADLRAVVRAGLVAAHQRRYAGLRAALGRAGVPVVRINDGDPVRVVLDRLDRVRGARARR